MLAYGHLLSLFPIGHTKCISAAVPQGGGENASSWQTNYAAQLTDI